MLRVGNKGVIRRLSLRSLKAARMRNIMAVCAIALTAILFTSLFTVGIGLIDSLQTATMRQVGTGAHGIIKYINDEDFEKIAQHPLVKEISYNRILADTVDNPELLKRHGELWYMNDTGLTHSFSQPTHGSAPVAENEIMADTKALDLLGVPHEIGAKITLDLTVKGKSVTREFVLSGWFEGQSVYPASIFITSRAYVDQYADELVSEYYSTFSLTGAINAYLMFANTRNMWAKLDQVMEDCGFQGEDPEAPNFRMSNINWAYVSGNMGVDPAALAAVAAGLLIITLTGYLIIYNIFQISVLRDIRFYGLLKTVGTTGRQIKAIIRRQALTLSAVGIPIGLVIGFFIGKAAVPLMMEQTISAGTQVNVSANPLIFIGAALFALITVWISTRKPGRVAASVSPVEATRYVEAAPAVSRGDKTGTSGGRLYKMALSNVGRSKRRAVLVLLSLSLSLVLVNTVYTLSQSFDMDKYLAKFVNSDFELRHADRINFNYRGLENSVDEAQIALMEGLPGFIGGGRVYYSREEIFTRNASDTGQTAVGSDGNPFTAVYGLDDYLLNQVDVLEGEIDLEKLKTGRYVLWGVHVDDNGKPHESHLNKYQVGDKVTLNNFYKTEPDGFSESYESREYEVMAKITVNQSIYDGHWDDTFYLPADEYCGRILDDPIMTYNFDVEEEYLDRVDAFLADYTENVDPVMSYNSKAVAQEAFAELQNLLLLIGGLLTFIVGLIGILNFTNTILTSIISRKTELAMLQSIGMTVRQLRAMLTWEGLYYALGTIALSLVLGVAVSLTVVRGLAGGMWFITYRFLLLPLLICWPLLLILAAAIALAASRSITRQSVVERLREAE